MNLEERKAKIEELKTKHPEFKRMCSWYSICNATRLCEEDIESMNDDFTNLLAKVEEEIKLLTKIEEEIKEV